MFGETIGSQSAELNQRKGRPSQQGTASYSSDINLKYKTVRRADK